MEKEIGKHKIVRWFVSVVSNAAFIWTGTFMLAIACLLQDKKPIIIALLICAFITGIFGVLSLNPSTKKKLWVSLAIFFIVWLAFGLYALNSLKKEFNGYKEKITKKPISETPKIEKPEIKALKSKLTLLDLFKKDDFNSLLRTSRDWELESKDGDKITIKSQVYSDAISQTKFLGFYIPNNPKTFEICQSIVGMYKNVLEHNSGLTFETSSPELQPVNSSELNFSGRVFIYHEYTLFDAQKRQLYDLYKSHGLSIQFRGQEYLWEKKKAE